MARPSLRLALLGPLAILGLLAAASTVRADEVEDLVRQLASPEGNKPYEAYRALIEKHPPEAFPLLVKTLPDCPRIGQQYGWYVLQGYPKADLRRVCERWSQDAPPFLKAVAAVWLVRDGEPKADGRLVEAIEACKADDSQLSLVLGQMNSLRAPKAQGAVRALVVPGAKTEVLGAALYYLRSVEDAEAKPAAAALLEGTPSERALGAAFLLRMGEDDRGADLAQALRSGDLSYLAFLRVQNLLYNAPRMPDVVLDALVAMLEAPPENFPLSPLVRLLGDHPYPKAVPALRKLLGRGDDAAKAAFEALSQIPGGITADAAKDLLSGPDEVQRVAAAEALRRADDPSGLPTVVEVLRGGKTARADAARALGGFRVRAAVDPLIDALLDADLPVRTAAGQSLATVLGALFPYRRLDLAAAGWKADGDDPSRRAAVDRIRAWWVAHRGGAW